MEDIIDRALKRPVTVTKQYCHRANPGTIVVCHCQIELSVAVEIANNQTTQSGIRRLDKVVQHRGAELPPICIATSLKGYE